MLYDPHLDIFLKVAEAGSFSKAATELYITPSAVIKQVNLFEKSLGVQLFERSPRGLQLTAAGRSLQRDAEGVQAVCNEAAYHAQEAMQEKVDLVRIGMSPITPIEPLSAVWSRVLMLEPKLRYQMIPFDNNKAAAKRILPNLGNTIDMVTGIVDPVILQDNACTGIVLKHEPLCIGVSMRNPLSVKTSLKLEDLAGERLMIPNPGFSGSIDRLRMFLERVHPEIQIVTTDIYTVEAFNHCHDSGDLLLSLKQWSSVHPMIRIIPVEWPYDVPVGILYAKNPSPSVRRFISALRRSVKKD